MPRGEAEFVTLNAWLDVATQEIEAQAAARIRQEYTAHLEDALAAGETELGFVAGLGSARAAQRAFYRTHLNTQDLRNAEPKGPLGRLHLLLVLATCLLGILATSRRDAVWMLFAVGLLLIGLGLRLWIQVMLTRGRLTRLQAGVLWNHGGNLVWFLALWLASGEGAPIWISVSYLALALSSVPTGLHAWRKLQRAGRRMA